MATLDEFSNICEKRVMGFEDFGTRLLGYTQGICRGIISRAYSNGSFLEKMALSSPGADQVQMDLKTGGAGDAHDGLGNILDLSLVTRSAVFENSNAVDYEVGAGYISKPYGIQINPTYGNPEYVKYIEDVGEQAEPDSVVDNGGTITFGVDSVTQNGEDNSGRTVRVFRKVPAAGALTPAIAIEECTVAYGGGENKITTTGTLGQTTVSTTASDYWVQLVGISVRRAAGNPISTSGAHFFAGVVTGNGGTPTVFDISGQIILAANSAVSISFTPYTGASPISWAIAATNMQTAIEEMVDDLTSVAGGANLICLDPSSYAQTAPSASASWGGLGTSGNEVKTKMTDADRQLARSRIGITHSVSQATMQADLQGIDSVISSWGSEKHFLKGTGTFLFTSSNMSKSYMPVIEGENILKSRLFAPTAVSGFNWYGVFKNLQMGATLYSILGDDGPFHAEHCLLAPNAFQHYGGGTATGGGGLGGNEATSMRSCHVPDSLSGSGTPLSSGTFQVITTSTGVSVDYFSNCVFVNETNGSPTFKTQGSPYNNGYAVSRKKVFVNCAFIQKESGQNALVVDGEDSHFIGCVIVIDAGGTANYTPAISITSGNRKVSFENCYVYSDSGKLVLSSAGTSHETSQRTFRGCHFSGAEADRDNSSQPCMIDTEGVDYIDCSFNMNATFMRFSGATDHMIKIKEGTLYNCKFRKATGTTDERTIHNYEWILFQDCKIRDLVIDVQSVYMDRDIAGPGNDSIFCFTDCFVDGFELNFIPTSWDVVSPGFAFFSMKGETTIMNLKMLTDFDTSLGSGNVESCIEMAGDYCKIIHARFEFYNSARPPEPTSKSYIEVTGDHCVLEDLFLYGYGGQWYFTSTTSNYASYGRTFIRVSNAHNCQIRKVRNNQGSNGAFNTFLVEFSDSSLHNGGSVENCEFTMEYEGEFIKAGTLHQSLRVHANHLFANSNSVGMGNNDWINLSSGNYNIVTENICLNEYTTTPAIQNTGTGAVINDNVLQSSVTLP